jgi:hypothetical protein
MGSGEQMRRWGHQTAAIAILAICVAAASSHGQPRSQARVIICTNPASGANWQISIDTDHSIVDGYPARINETQISWRDAKDGGNYTLDRRSGDLTMVAASSTGGYFLHYHCTLPP